MKGVGFGVIGETMVEKSKCFMLALQQRQDIHFADRVDYRRRYHWTLDLIQNNIASIGAAKFLVGHIADNLESYRFHD